MIGNCCKFVCNKVRVQLFPNSSMLVIATCGVIQEQILRKCYMSSSAFLDIDLRNKDGFAAIHLAVKYRKKEILELLLANGAKMNLFDSTGKTALHIATRKANKELLQV